MKYELDKILNTVINDDCLNVLKDLPDKCVDLVLTDPPYGIRADENPVTGGFGYNKTSWDRERPKKEIFDEILRISKNQIIWGGNYFIDHIKIPTMGWLVWDKETGEGFSLADGELAWTSFDKAMRIFKQNRANFKSKDGCHHPTQKSLELIKFCIQYADRSFLREQALKRKIKISDILRNLITHFKNAKED